MIRESMHKTSTHLLAVCEKGLSTSTSLPQVIACLLNRLSRVASQWTARG